MAHAPALHKDPRYTALDNRDMLCFSHDWSGDPLSKTHLMRLLAQRNRVLWVNSIGYRTPTASRRDLSRAAGKLLAAASPLQEPEPNLFVLSPLAIPAYGRPWARVFNRWFLRQQVLRAMRSLRFERPINWVFNPAAALIAGSLGEDMLIYYCVDEYSAFSGVAAQTMLQMEEGLLSKADLVIASSDRLFQAKRKHNHNTALVRHGVDWSHFRKALEFPRCGPTDISRLRRPIIGYFGLIAEDWVDLELLTYVAQRMPHASIVMLGKATMDVTALRRFSNVHLLGRKPYSDLPAYSAAFDAAIIPFPISEVTLNANPLKAREYLAAGLPVVSTAIPEVEVMGNCQIAHDPESFVNALESALLTPGPSASRNDTVRNESWEARLADIDGLVSNVLNGRSHSLSLQAVRKRAA